jgi:hypothetical protein
VTKKKVFMLKLTPDGQALLQRILLVNNLLGKHFQYIYIYWSDGLDIYIYIGFLSFMVQDAKKLKLKGLI